MRFKDMLAVLVEKLTGKTCEKCKHNINGISCDNYQRYFECVESIFPKGFERKETKK